MRRPIRALLPFIVSGLLAGIPAAAIADARTELQAQVAEGQRLFKAGRHREALAAFTEAASGGKLAAGDARLHWNIGRCHEELDDPARAVAAFELAARLADDADFRAQAADRARALRASHFGALVVACADRARVRMEGLPGEKGCPARWDMVRAGRYGGTLLDADGRTTRFVTTIAVGDEARVDLLRADLEVDCEGGIVRVAGLPDARPCPAKWTAVGVGAYTGEHRSADGRVRPFAVEVLPAEGGRIRLSTPADDSPGAGAAVGAGAEAGAAAGAGPWPWLAGGVGLAALGAGAWFAVDAADAADAARNARDDAAYDEAVERLERDRIGHHVTLGLGVALVATSAVLFILDADNGRSSALGRPTASGWVWTW